jgi:PAS domain S-box-containing protein
MHLSLPNLAESLTRSTDPAFVVDGNGMVVAWNPAAEAAFGHPHQDVLGKPCHEIIRGKDAFGNPMCRYDCLVVRNLREAKPARRFRMYVHATDGNHVEVECSTLGLKDTYGEMVILHFLRLWPEQPRSFEADPTNDQLDVACRQPSLTRRQKDVLRLLAKGKSTKEIASELFVTPATVRTHVQTILEKLAVHSRLEAVLTASRAGLI